MQYIPRDKGQWLTFPFLKMATGEIVLLFDLSDKLLLVSTIRNEAEWKQDPTRACMNLSNLLLPAIILKHKTQFSLWRPVTR